MKCIEHRNKVVREHWDDETEEVKKEIAEYREWLYAHGPEDEGNDEEDEDEFGDNEDEGDEDNAPVGKGKGKATHPISPAEAKAQEYHM